DHLHGERLVQLPEIDLVHRDAGALEEARDGEHGPDPHLVGSAGGDGEPAEDPERMQPAALRQLRVHDDARGGAVRELAGVARGDVPLLAGHGLERGEALERRVRPVALVLLEQRVLDARLARRLVDDHLLRRHRHDLGVEAPGLLAGGGALLAHQRVLVLLFARDVVALGDDLGRLDHRHVDLRLVLLQPLLAHAMEVHVLVLHEADRLQPAGDHDRHAVHDHALRGERDGLHARGTEAVDGHAGRGHREPRAQRGLARDVLTRRALWQRAAHDDVLDLAGLEARALAGALYALVALSFVVVYRASRMMNFAVGEWVMLASRCVTFALHGLGLGLPGALAVGCAGMAGFGVAFNRVVLRRLVGQPVISV